MKKLLVVFLVLIGISTSGYSQDLKAGEINVKLINGYTYEATVFIYQNIPTLIPRPYIIVYFGDNSFDTLQANSNGCYDTNTTTIKYIGNHTFPWWGSFNITTFDSFRVSNLQNINNSSNEKLFLSYQLTISPYFTNYYSPVSSSCLIDAWTGPNWVYNPNSFDGDGDSLGYSLVSPYTTNYTMPPASVNPVTGDMTFNPTATGRYAFCMKIDEWRMGIIIGSTLRQMLVIVNSLTGIPQISPQPTISLYPNPFSTSTTLVINGEIKENSHLYIYNLLGQEVKTISIINQNQITINRDNLAEGMYFYKIISDKGESVAVGKMVIE